MTGPAVRVLLVDDDEDEYAIVSDLLGSSCRENFELTWAPTYELGLEAILASRCDVCLVDYRLGRRNGLDLLAEVTAASNSCQIILLTGEGDRDVDVTATKAGAADYLVKGELTEASLERSIRYATERGRTLEALRKARESAESLNLAKSAFLAAMSHEIRTPMNAILGMADMLWESPLTAEQLQYVEVFRRAGSGLLLLINDILDLSKIEAGHLELEHVAFDLEEIVDSAIELTAVKARAKGIALLSHLSPGIKTSLMGDPSRLRQVLLNLLGNAVKFTASGEVVLSVRAANPDEPLQLEFAVSDTGIGIPSDRVESIFDDFTQADTSTTRKYGGTGLGLGISRRLVEAMGGHLTAASTVGKGSTFQFGVKFDPAPENTSGIHVPLEDLFGKRVLVIDDNATSCFILSETLQTWGLDSDAFRLPAEALAGLPGAMASDHPYSLAVIGSCMPGMDGFQAAAEIGLIAASLPVVMLTSDARPEDTTRRDVAGLSGYAVKPVTRTQLLRLVCDAMHLRSGPGLRQAANPELTKREPARPARILIAEDSPDNRVLIQVYLRLSPHKLVFEEDGRAAVNRFAAADFDLILMDMKMPVMDGFDSTRAIRAIERDRGSSPIPILALTANASLKDVERSASAGCNAHLSKPISKLQLLDAIEKFALQLKPEEVTQADFLGAIRIEISPGLEEIVPDYLDRRRREVVEMRALLAASDFKSLAVLAHNLKGTGGGYGFPNLTRLGSALEQSAKQKDSENLQTQMTELSSYLDHVQLIETVNV